VSLEIFPFQAGFVKCRKIEGLVLKLKNFGKVFESKKR
jgi:hypothetical protein